MNNMDNSAVLMTDNEFSIPHLLVFHAHNLFRMKLQFPVLSSCCEAIYVLLRLRVQNRRTKWNFPLNFRTMRKLSELYSGIFQTQSSG